MMKKKWMNLNATKYLMLFSTLSMFSAPLMAEPIPPIQPRARLCKRDIALEGPRVRILLLDRVPSALLEVRGEYRVVQKESGTILSTGKTGKRFRAHALSEGLRWGEEYPDVYQVVIKPTSEATSFYVDGIQYKGAIALYHCKDDLISVVNEISMEDFLKSTLAMQFCDSVSQEAMAALVILARTEMYEQIEKNRASGRQRQYDFSASDVNYLGHGVTRQIAGLDRAIESTRFMVVRQGNQPGLTPKEGLETSRAEELALGGLDASQILRTIYPKSAMCLTSELARENQNIR